MPGRSYGLAIARRLGVPAGVLVDAEGRVSEAERALDRLLEAAEFRVRRLTADQAALAERLGDAERETARLARQGEQQEARERELRAREKDAERRARAEARRVLLDARERVEEALRAAAQASDERSAKEARRLLEDAIRIEGAALAESAAPDADGAGGVEGGALAPGQRVRLPTGSTAELLELRGDGKAVVLAGAMRMVVPVDGLVVEGAREPGSSGARAHHPRSSPAPQLPSAPMEIDLRGLRGDEAEAVTVAALDAAVLADHPYLKIIHGMGTGVVRERVRRLLGADRRVVKFEFAPRNQGGTGVTIAELGG
jgi:DNA mismatch repair protein MutS2